MSINNFTVKSQEVIQKALEIASSKGNQAIEPVHLLKAMLLVDENVIPYLLKKINVNIETLSSSINRVIDNLPAITSGGEQYLSKSY